MFGLTLALSLWLGGKMDKPCACESTGKVIAEEGVLYWKYFEKHGDYEVMRRIPIVKEAENAMPSVQRPNVSE